jgi:phage replication protein O protein
VNRTSSESEPVTSSESEHTKNNIKNTIQNTNKKNKQKKTELFESHFEKFWNAGMRKVNKKKALSSFIANYELYNAKYPTELEDFTQILVDDVKKRIRLGEFGFDKLHPMTYLNNWRWEDESPAENKTQEQKPSAHINFGDRNYGEQVIPEWALEDGNDDEKSD